MGPRMSLPGSFLHQKNINIIKEISIFSAVAVFGPINILLPDHKPVLKCDHHQFQLRV
jgi:hypothetical protein